MNPELRAALIGTYIVKREQLDALLAVEVEVDCDHRPWNTNAIGSHRCLSCLGNDGKRTLKLGETTT